MSKEINIDDVFYSDKVYPRFKPNYNKITEYTENIELLPPIKVNQDCVLIDGYHRLEAHKKLGYETIKVEVINTSSFNELTLLSAMYNAKHGIPLSQKEKKEIAVKLYDGTSEMQEKLKNELSVGKSTFYEWMKDVDSNIRQQEFRNIVFEYLRADKTQLDVGELFGKSQQHIDNIIKHLENILQQIPELENIVNSIEEKNNNNKSLNREEEIYLAFKDELNELKDFKPFIYNVWNTPKINNEQTHFGNFPIEFMENLLYYYTEPFDIVYDPFAGGGVVIDACIKWFRRYYTTDKYPIHERKDEISEHDIRDGPPYELDKPKFVFLDPPYWRQAQNEYSEDENDLANMDLESFYSTLKTYINQLYDFIKPNGYIGLVIAATQWPNENKEREDHAFQLTKIAEEAGFKLVQRFVLPYSTEQYNGNQVNTAKDEKICLNIYRDLVVLQKCE